MAAAAAEADGDEVTETALVLLNGSLLEGDLADTAVVRQEHWMRTVRNGASCGGQLRTYRL